MRTYLLLLTTLLCLKSFSQITFEKGYFIDDSNVKTECLIKNIDWKNNPTSFEYKNTPDSQVHKKDITTIKEFGITNFSKYIKAIVQIDRSSNNTNNLSSTRNPVFKKEQLFLKVLIEGNATLYSYQDGNLPRYFIKINNGEINQLVYKKYIRKNDYSTNNKTEIINNSRIMENNYYQQQLLNISKDNSISRAEVIKLSYNKKYLTRFFQKLNGEDYTIFPNTILEKRDVFNLTLRPGLNYSNLTLDNQSIIYGPFKFTNTINFRMGIEAEFILPYNKNKWSIIIEPTYQYFKDEISVESSNITGGLINSSIDYSSIEVPIGCRHYFFLKNQSKIFINAAYTLDLCMNSNFSLSRKDGSNINEINLSSRGNICLGAGYKLKNKYSIEFRYFTNRNITSDYINWNSSYKTTSIIFGYSIF